MEQEMQLGNTEQPAHLKFEKKQNEFSLIKNYFLNTSSAELIKLIIKKYKQNPLAKIELNEIKIKSESSRAVARRIATTGIKNKYNLLSPYTIRLKLVTLSKLISSEEEQQGQYNISDIDLMCKYIYSNRTLFEEFLK